MKTQKDYRIELYRFIFAILIMIFHAHNINNGKGHPIPLGHVFVEFFFFLTGYFTYASINSRAASIDISIYPFQYTWKKFKRFIPFATMTAALYVGVSIMCNCFIKQSSFRETFFTFSGLPFDVLFLQITGICKNPNFNAWWYLSAILFIMPLIVFVFHKKITQGGLYTYIVYFVPVLIYGAFSLETGGLDWDRQVFGTVKSGLFRSFAGLCVGSIIFDLKDKLCILKDTKYQRLFLTLAELLSYSLSVLIAWRWSHMENATFLIVIFLIIGLTISFSNRSYTVWLNKPIFGHLGIISLPVYMCHYSIGRLIERYITNNDILIRYSIYFISSFVFAILMHEINKRMISKGVAK